LLVAPPDGYRPRLAKHSDPLDWYAVRPHGTSAVTLGISTADVDDPETVMEAASVVPRSPAFSSRFRSK